MFKAQNRHILIVDNQHLCWVVTGGAERGACLYRLPLENLIGDAPGTPDLPEALKRNSPTLAIVPDHWFGGETFPFRSTKPALIEAFLSRKLAQSHPEQPAIRQFFNYKYVVQGDQTQALYAGFLTEPRWYRLYPMLCRLNQAPLRVTSPGFVWEGQLQKMLPEFKTQGTLLIQMGPAEGRLYFFHRGQYLFSRSVALPDAEDRLQVLSYEVNQSLYLFSQKAKCELDGILLQADDPAWEQALRDALGREVALLPDPAVEGADRLAIPQAPFLSGLLATADVRRRNSQFFNVIHRQVKRDLAWRPVQWAGLTVGILLTLLLAGESALLDFKLQTARAEQQSLKSETDAVPQDALGEAETVLDQVLQTAERPQCAAMVLKLLGCLPAGVWLKEISLELEAQPSADLAAVVEARDAPHLIAVLNQVVAAINHNIPRTESFTIDDIDVGTGQTEFPGAASGYLIRFRLELT